MVDFENLKLKKTWIRNYLPKFKENKVIWVILNSSEYSKFLKENYSHKSFYLGLKDVETRNLIPLGLTFTTFNIRQDDAKFLISYMINGKGYKTILTCFRYYENYSISPYCEMVTLASYVETNYFYRGLGLYKLTVNKFSEMANINDCVLTTPISKDGKICHAFDYLKEVLSEKDILVFDNMFDIMQMVKIKKLTK